MRGVFGTSLQLFSGIGMLIVYGISAIPEFQYYYVAVVAIGISVLFELLALWLRETPRWLYSKHGEEKAKAVLKWLRGPKISIVKELNELQNVISQKKTFLEALRMFSRKTLLHPLILVLIFAFFVGTSGLSVVGSLAGPLYATAGVPNHNLAVFYSIGIIGVVSTLISVPLLDLIGRKPLLIVGGIGLLCGTAMMGTQFYLTRPTLCVNQSSLNENATSHNMTGSDIEIVTDSIPCNPQYIPMAISGLLVFRASFSFSWSSIQMILTSEIFPVEVRGVANSFTSTTIWLFLGIVGGAYLSYEKAVTPWFAMWSFSITIVLGVVFIIVFIPETKGRSLEEIQLWFEQKHLKMKKTTNSRESKQ